MTTRGGVAKSMRETIEGLRAEVERLRADGTIASLAVAIAERDALTEKLSLVTEDYIRERNAAEQAESALREMIEAEDNEAPIPRGWFARARAALVDEGPVEYLGMTLTPRLSTEAEAKAAMGDGQRLVKMREIER